MGFYYADKKIWVRNYQIIEDHASNAKEAHEQKKAHGKNMATSLAEIGPRFVLNPIRIFRGSFGGQTLYSNQDYISPNEIRALERRDKSDAYVNRKESQKKVKECYFTTANRIFHLGNFAHTIVLIEIQN